MSADGETSSVTTVPDGVGGAVGMEKCRWYVAVVNNNTEKSVSEKLSALGHQHYLPLQTEYRIWKNGRRAKVDRVIIPTVIFIRCSEKERREIVTYPFINRFMVNKAAQSSPASGKPLAVIPDEQIERLRFMVGNSDTPVTFSASRFRKGDTVRVIRGRLAGLEGEILDLNAERSELIVSLDFLGSARLSIETINVEPLPNN